MSIYDVINIFKRQKDVINPKGTDGIKPPRIINTKTNSVNRLFEINQPLHLVYKAYRSDSIIKQLVLLYVELLLQNGFKVSSQNKELEEKVNKRLREIEFNSNTTIYEIIRNGLKDMILLGNLFFVFVRDKKFLSGKPYKYNDKTQEPILGIYPVPLLSMLIQRRTTGEIYQYKQNPLLINREYNFFTKDENVIVGDYYSSSLYVRIFNLTDVLHFKYDEDLMTGFGRPFYFETIDDLLILREIEGIVEEIITTGKLMYAYYRAGNSDKPTSSQKEIDDAKLILEQNEPYGVLVIPDNHTMDVKSTNVLQEILLFYDRMRMRVYGLLGLSTVLFGEAGSANRLTAESVSNQMVMKVRDFQKLFLSQFQHQILEHIILDLGYNPKTLGDDMPKLVFNEPDIDLAIKKQNHAVYLYEHSAITQSEMRKLLDMPKISEQEDMYIYRVKIPLLIAGKDINTQDTDNRVEPKNQHTNDNN